MRWEWKRFDELSTKELYEILALRAAIFVVEQNCVYQDCDGVDLTSYHLMGREAGELVAYLRAVPAGVKYPEASLGRVITAARVRRSGAGRALMTEALKRIGASPLRISAQSYLEKFYQSFGFRLVGDTYLEDGIPHREMVRP